jgi:hypothetical protein
MCENKTSPFTWSISNMTETTLRAAKHLRRLHELLFSIDLPLLVGGVNAGTAKAPRIMRLRFLIVHHRYLHVPEFCHIVNLDATD